MDEEQAKPALADANTSLCYSVVATGPLGLVVAKHSTENETYLYVKSVKADSALCGKLFVHDIIRTVGGQKVSDLIDLIQVIQQKSQASPTREVTFAISRNVPPSLVRKPAARTIEDSPTQAPKPVIQTEKEATPVKGVTSPPATIAPTRKRTAREVVDLHTTDFRGGRRKKAWHLEEIPAITPTLPPRREASRRLRETSPKAAINGPSNVATRSVAISNPPIVAPMAAKIPPPPTRTKHTITALLDEIQAGYEIDVLVPPSPFLHRPAILEEILLAWHLDEAAESLQKIMLQDEVKSSSILKIDLAEKVASLIAERDEKMNVSEEKLTRWEVNFRLLIRYKIEKKPLPTGAQNKPFLKWVGNQRKRRRQLQAGELKANAIPRAQSEGAFLDRVGFPWVGRNNRSFDDWFAILREFHAQHGNCRVPQVHPVLGEWIKCMRKEYELFNEGKTSRLNQERINSMNAIGFIWKVRFGRPRKGDERFRLRRRSEGDADSKEKSETVTTVVEEEK